MRKKWKVASVKWKVKKTLNFQLSTFNSEGGQTLVEALAAVAVAVIIVTSLVTLGIATQRAASTSRNQNQNTKYGEETLELIRSIRDAKFSGSVRGVTAFACNTTNSCSFADLYTSPFVSPTSFTPVYFTLSSALVTAGCTSGVSSVDCYQLTKAAGSTPVQIGSTIYSRAIKIWDSANTTDTNDPADKVKFVEVLITWSDQGGIHTSDTTTKLTNFK